MNVTAADQPDSPSDGSLDLRPNEQNVNNCAMDNSVRGRNQHVHPIFAFFNSTFPSSSLDDRAKAEGDARGLLHNFTTPIKEQL
jgi:hypothetical protein